MELWNLWDTSKWTFYWLFCRFVICKTHVTLLHVRRCQLYSTCFLVEAYCTGDWKLKILIAICSWHSITSRIEKILVTNASKLVAPYSTGPSHSTQGQGHHGITGNECFCLKKYKCFGSVSCCLPFLYLSWIFPSWKNMLVSYWNGKYFFIALSRGHFRFWGHKFQKAIPRVMPLHELKKVQL